MIQNIDYFVLYPSSIYKTSHKTSQIDTKGSCQALAQEKGATLLCTHARIRRGGMHSHTKTFTGLPNPSPHVSSLTQASGNLRHQPGTAVQLQGRQIHHN